MSLLNPALAAFAAAIAVPILIHLLNRRRFRRVPWAAMRFLRTSIEKNQRRMELEDLILLILRCLVVALFAFALARPALRSAAAILDTGRAAAVIILDHSASMGASDGARTRLDLARTAAQEALDAFPAGSAFAVLLGGSQVTEAIADPTTDLNLVRRVLREAPLSDLGSDHANAIARAAEILGGVTALRKEIVLVTDHHGAGWRGLPEFQQALRQAGADTRLRVVMVGERTEDNLAVVGLQRSPGFVSGREPVRFHADVANYGATPVQQVRATLHVGNGPVIDESVLDVLRPGESRRVTFFGRVGAPGYHGVSVRLPGDRLPADDQRTLMVRAVETARVLVVDGNPAANGGFFLRNALQPVPEDAAANYHLQPRIIPVPQLALTRLPDYDAVILSEVSTLPSTAVDALTRYVTEGGALLLFLGPGVQAAAYNAELGTRAGLLPAVLGTPRVAEESADGFQLQGPPYDHPIVTLWNEPGAGSLAQARFRGAWPLLPLPGTSATTSGVARAAGPAVDGVPRVILRFTDGSTAAAERTVGRGRVVLFASTASPTWNDLPVRPAFVPLLHRAIARVAEAQEERLNLRAGLPAELRLAPHWAGRELSITGPGEPERRFTATARPVPGAAALTIEETGRAGLYLVTPPGEREAIGAFAVQPDPGESDLAALAPETQTELGRVAQVLEWNPDTDLRGAFERERLGVELWLPLVMGVLGLGLVEGWLAQRFSRAK